MYSDICSEFKNEYAFCNDVFVGKSLSETSLSLKLPVDIISGSEPEESRLTPEPRNNDTRLESMKSHKRRFSPSSRSSKRRINSSSLGSSVRFFPSEH